MANSSPRSGAAAATAEPLLNAVHAIAVAKNAAAVCEAVQAFVVHQGGVSFAIGRDVHCTQWQGDPEIYTWPPALVASYLRFGRIHVDDALAKIRQGKNYAAWGRRTVFDSAEDEKMAAILDDAAIGGGILVGIRGGVSACSVFSISTPTPRDPEPHFLDACRLVGDAALLKLSLPSAQRRAPAVRLGERQLEILKWAAQGKSNRDIATILGVSERNVVYHMSRAMAVMNVRSRAQAIAWLVQHHADTLLA